MASRTKNPKSASSKAPREPLGAAAKTLQQRVADQPELLRFVRHLNSLSIDLDDEEISLEANQPETAFPFGTSSVNYSRSFDLGDHPALRDAVKNLVHEVHQALFKVASDYDPKRCDRCVKSDCCSIDRIHLTDDERIRILEHIGEKNTKAASAKYFEPDDDLGNYYKHIMRHVNGACTFLKPIGPGGMMRCSIYDVRPNVCREYDPGYCTEASELRPRRSPLEV